ncbi:TPA: hypothetical protein SE995_001186 [Campylobacter jejuni]|nr:hypothetical protein [Campylobacter jejuni]HEG7018066.1 hypothetical protein [Campylobacter jejuni]
MECYTNKMIQDVILAIRFFIIGINIGAFIAPLICGFVQAKWNYHLGFCIGGG